jgi:predicted adenylyl cyclase CyaB
MKENNYEIEIKCLLGNHENAQALETRMRAMDPTLHKVGTHKQLNHYFEGKGDFKKIAELIEDKEEREVFLNLAEKAKDFSLRTRDADGKVILVLKAAIDDTTSANGTARREFEKTLAMPLADLDKTILDAGFSYQAKWSRERTDYVFNGVNVTIDKNAGYGYLAEFEIIENDAARAEVAKAKLRTLIKDVGLEELNQERLGRMFAHYNEHWRDYYGTDKIFVIE